MLWSASRVLDFNRPARRPDGPLPSPVQVVLGLDHVVRTGVYLADMRDWEAIARAHREAFGEIRPACTWIECGTMIHPDMLVEIDAIAVE